MSRSALEEARVFFCASDKVSVTAVRDNIWANSKVNRSSLNRRREYCTSAKEHLLVLKFCEYNGCAVLFALFQLGVAVGRERLSFALLQLELDWGAFICSACEVEGTFQITLKGYWSWFADTDNKSLSFASCIVWRLVSFDTSKTTYFIAVQLTKFFGRQATPSKRHGHMPLRVQLHRREQIPFLQQH